MVPVILIFTALNLLPSVYAELISAVDNTQSDVDNRLSAIVNSFAYGGDFFIAADLLQVSMDWSITAQDIEMSALLKDLEDLRLNMHKQVKDKSVLELADERIHLTEKQIRDEQARYKVVAEEIIWKENSLQSSKKEERNIFTNLAELFLGWNQFTLSRRMDKLAKATVRTSKALAMDEEAIVVLKNYVHEVKQSQLDIIHVASATDMMRYHASHVIRHYKAKTAFLQALARDKLELSLLSFDHYAKLMRHTDSVIEKAHLHWVEDNLDDAPFTISMSNDTLRISCYLTVQPERTPKMEAFYPKEAIFHYNGTLFRTGEPEEALVAFSSDLRYTASLSYDDYGACRKTNNKIICYDYRTLHKAAKTCATARFTQSLSEIIKMCNMTPLDESAAYWIVHNQLMTFIGPHSKIQQVNETCPKSTQLLHASHIPLAKDCTYETEDMIIFADTQLTIKLDLDKAFKADFQLEQLQPFEQAKVLQLQLGNAKVFTTEDFNAFDPLKEYAGYIVLAMGAGTLAALGSLGCYLYRHKRQVLNTVAQLNPEMAAVDAAREAVATLIDKKKHLEPKEEKRIADDYIDRAPSAQEEHYYNLPCDDTRPL